MLSRCICFVLWSMAVLAGPKVTDRASLMRKLPLRFEENHDPKLAGARYRAMGANFTFGIGARESWLEWREAGSGKRGAIQTALLGANRRVTMEPGDPQSGTTNYFLGLPAAWRTDVRGYGRVRSAEVYPGIDLMFHSDAGNELEYDFIVKPHADFRRIRLRFSGQSGARLEDGALVLETGAGKIRWKHPEIYQERDGARTAIPGGFVMLRRDVIGFEVGDYDASRPLIIDPVMLSYSTYLGGSGNDSANAVALDVAGDVYLAGSTESPNLPVVSAFQSTFAGTNASSGSGEAFLAKFSPSGSLLYLTYLGGSGSDAALGLAIDGAGNAYVTGFTASPDFPLAGPLQSKFGGSGGPGYWHPGDAFVAKVSPTGNKLIYSTYLGGSRDDEGVAIAIDYLGEAYVTGATASPNFPVTAGAYQTALKGTGGEVIEPCCGGPFLASGDAFVAKLDPTGSTLVFSTYLGGSMDDQAATIALDNSFNVYIGGYTISSDFPTTTGAFQRTYGGADQQTPYFVTGDGFIAKLNAAGTELVYSTYFGGNGDELISKIVVDLAGDVYFTGYSSTENLPVTANAVQRTYGGYLDLPFDIEYRFGDAIVGELNPQGSALLYLTYLGGEANDGGSSLAVDSSGNIYVVGFTDSPSFFPTTSNAFQRFWAGDGGSAPFLPFGDAFLSVLNPNSSTLIYSTFLGGSRDDEALDVALDAKGNVYVVGATYSTDFKLTANAFQSSFGGYLNVFPDWPWGDAIYSVFSGFPAAPAAIAKVVNAEGLGTVIAPNTWIAIQGAGLTRDSREWQSSDFVNNQLPTALDGASVTINGENAYIYYISPYQINALTPPDMPTSGSVQVQVTSNGQTGQSFTVTAQPYSPAFFAFNGGPYIIATHLNYSLVGPTTLYPGATTPANPGEQIVIYANGFGPITPAVTKGSISQSGNLPTLPTVMIGGQTASVVFAGLVSPGLYQFNVVVPNGVQSGDNIIVAMYNGFTTQAGTLLTIQ